jgi:PAS domain S-box-containing protein
MSVQPSAEFLLEAFLSNPAEAIVCFGLDGVIFLWNQAAEALYGFSQKEILGKSVSSLLPLYELPAHAIMLKDPSCAASLSDAVAERLNRSGLRVSVRIQRSPVRDARGEIVGILERSQGLAPGGSCSIAEAHLSLLVEQIPLFFWTTDLHLRVTSHWGRTASLARSFPDHLPIPALPG